MKTTSKVILGATMVMVATLALVLGLLLVLLAELYCSLLLGRPWKLKKNSATTAATADLNTYQAQIQVATSLSSFYAQGVVQAPRSILYPFPSNTKEVQGKRHQVIEIIHTQESIEEISVAEDHVVYISNPVYENVSVAADTYTPFHTPDTSSHSQLKTSDDEVSNSSPPLTPMKKLPAEACSVSLRDARSLDKSSSESYNTHDNSSSSGSPPCTSPSW